MNNMKIDIIGTYPPPVGGTSIHLQRLFKHCKDNGIDAVVYDTHASEKEREYEDNNIIGIKNYKKFLLKYFFNKRADIIHSHTHSWNERMILTLKATVCHQKIVFTFHSFRDDRKSFSLLKKLSCRYVLKHADKFILSNDEIKNKLILWGCKSEKISIITPFLVPIKSNMNLDKELAEFISKFDYIITANASNNNHFNGEDLYGIDMCIDLEKLISEKYNVGFIFVLTKITDGKYFDELKDKIDSDNLGEKFLLYCKNIDLVSLQKNSTVFVRPTNTDSWGMSISESIFVGCPVVASNVCQRQEGTILFKARSQSDFESKVEKCIDNIEIERKKIQNIKIDDGATEIFKVYKTLFDKYI